MRQRHVGGGSGMKGVWTAVLAFVLVAAVYLGFAAVTVLVVALDSGGAMDPMLVGQLTWLFVAVSQGIGVNFSGVLIGIPALLLLLFNMGVIASLVRRHGPAMSSAIIGTLVWTALTGLVLWKGGVSLHGTLWLALLKSAAVFAGSTIVAALPQMLRALGALIGSRISSPFAVVMREAARVVRWCVMSLIIESVVVVALWFILNHDAMGKVFAMTGMPTGSRVITTILTLFWLPNLCLWALSWLFGAGFSLGTLGTFTLWTGSAHDLPPIPIFGIFPQAVAEDWTRMGMLMLPLITGLVIGFIELVSSRGFNYFNLTFTKRVVDGVQSGVRTLGNLMPQRWMKAKPNESVEPAKPTRRAASAADALGAASATGATAAMGDVGETRDTDAVNEDSPLQSPAILRLRGHGLLQLILVKAVYPLVSFSISGILLVLISAVAFSLSNGSLGTENLASIGVNVAASTQAVARPIFSGFLIAWVLAVVILTVKALLIYRQHREAPTTSLTDADLIDVNSEDNAE